MLFEELSKICFLSWRKIRRQVARLYVQVERGSIVGIGLLCSTSR